MIFFKLFIFFCNLWVLTSCETCDPVRDIVFLLDCSTSIQESSPRNQLSKNWNLLKDFLIQVIKRLPIESSKTRSTVLTFSTSVHPNDGVLYDVKDKLVANVKNLVFHGGNTNTSGALRYARQLLAASPTSFIVLLTDGMSNVDSSSTLQEARANKQLSITQLAVGVGEFVDENELQDLVSDPASYHYHHASDFSTLHLLVDPLVEKLTCPQAPLPEPCRDSRADVVFVLDASGSINVGQDEKLPNSNWFFMKQFFADVARKLNIGSNETRVGLIRFSHIAEVMFHMDEFTDVDRLVQRISSIEIIGSETNTQEALRLMNDVAFTPQHGDRPDVQNVAIVMTDGQSNVNESQTIPEAERAKQLGVRVFVVGLTQNINVQELRAMSSLPLQEHFFTRNNYSLVQSVVSNLVWNVCQDYCTTQPCTPTQSRCPTGSLLWRKEQGGLIVGHDYSRLSDISSAAACQRVCLQDPFCKSVEFIAAYSECSVSHFRRSDVPFSFKADPEVAFYEWFCG